MASRPNSTECEPLRRRGRILERALAEAREALHRQAARNAPREADAEDALQEACADFLRLYDGPPGADAIRWLLLAVKHRAWERGRRERARGSCLDVATVDVTTSRSLHLCSERPGPQECAERAEQVAEFSAAFARLKPDQRVALLLLGLGYSYAEIAARQSWTYTKVNRCLAEGRAALRALSEGR